MKVLQLHIGEEVVLRTPEGDLVPLRRKGLALLLYLTLEGETPRNRIAQLLWRPRSGLQNLRVELASLRKTLREAGWGKGSPMLGLPKSLEVKRKPHWDARNLEGLSPEFDEWLQRVRPRKLQDASPVLPKHGLLILEAYTGDDPEAFIQSLRRTHPSVQRLPQSPVIEDCLRHKGLLIYVRSNFGEDPLPLLQLRARMPADRVRYTTLPGFSFQALEAAHGFERAGRVWLSTHGRTKHVRATLDSGLDVPQQIRAAYAIEARYLRQSTRTLLEKLSLHPGPMPEAPFEDQEEALEELLTRRWLVEDDGRLRFRDPVSRRALAAGMGPERTPRLHRGLARRVAEHQPFGAYYHLRLSGATPPLPDQPLPGWAQAVLERTQVRAPTLASYALGPLRLPPEHEVEGLVEEASEVFYFLRDHVSTPTRLRFQGQEEPSLVQVKLRAVVENPLGIGLTGDALPLAIRSHAGAQAFAGVPEDGPNAFRLDVGERWFFLPSHAPLIIESLAEAAIFALRFRFFALGTGMRVQAINLGAQQDSRTLRASSRRA